MSSKSFSFSWQKETEAESHTERDREGETHTHTHGGVGGLKLHPSSRCPPHFKPCTFVILSRGPEKRAVAEQRLESSWEKT